MHHAIIGVLRGGDRSRYNHSLKSGAALITALSSRHYGIRDLVIHPDQTVFIDGVALRSGREALAVDAVISTVSGEQHPIERQLAAFSIPFAAQGHIARALSARPHAARTVARRLGIRAPRLYVVRAGADVALQANRIITEAPFPLLVSVAYGTTGHGRIVVRHFEALLGAIHELAQTASMIFIERFRDARRFTVGVIENYRNEPFYALPVADRTLFDGNNSDRVPFVPAMNVNMRLKKDLAEKARALHHAFGARSSAMYDFEIGTDGEPFFLEHDATPSVADGELFNASLVSVGINPHDYIDHLISCTRNRDVGRM